MKTENCPRCGEERSAYPDGYCCGSYYLVAMLRLGGFEESKLCLRRQRDQLLARVKRLEKALERIASADYRGNRSEESRIAAAALMEVDP